MEILKYGNIEILKYGNIEIFHEGRFLQVEVYLLEPCLHVEAGTVFLHPGQVAVTHNLGLWIVGAEALQEIFHTLLLRLGTGVGRLAVLVEAALVADTDAVGVVVAGVGSRLVLGTAGIYHAILRDVIVVADVAEAAGLVAGFQLLHREASVGTGGTAMYHNQVDFSGILHLLSVEC